MRPSTDFESGSERRIRRLPFYVIPGEKVPVWLAPDESRGPWRPSLATGQCAQSAPISSSFLTGDAAAKRHASASGPAKTTRRRLAGSLRPHRPRAAPTRAPPSRSASGQRVRVPGRAGTWFERDLGAAHASGLRRLEKRTDADSAGEPVLRTLLGGPRPAPRALVLIECFSYEMPLDYETERHVGTAAVPKCGRVK
ncbi:hypothetical protein SAMN05443248_4074 [Bradyrhizobium erythrophlei]|uniref:Uncharacterized protein n=1 Tax=Bradyrhizobium erythrophlei TaxID=1437360 RepID=A0A1M5R3T9_9BRAD|nr:hypothetical protein SAMN05443248_4074 [Bradyrhizobium erythrophlei]